MMPESSGATPVMEETVIGIIGMGLMGKMYARRLSDAGWRYETFDSCEIPLSRQNRVSLTMIYFKSWI